MKIVEIKCLDCGAVFEGIESYPKELIECISCGSKNLDFTETDREFEGCGGQCGDCTSCE